MSLDASKFTRFKHLANLLTEATIFFSQTALECIIISFYEGTVAFLDKKREGSVQGFKGTVCMKSTN